jgi:hypothetical protein
MPIPPLFLRFAAFAAFLNASAWAQPSALDFYAGYYRNGQAVFRISHDGGSLYSQGPGEPNIELKQSGHDRFVGPHWAYQFVRNRSGKVTGLHEESRGQVTLWPRLPEAEARLVSVRQAANLARRTPHPGVEATLTRHILAIEQGAPLYDELGPVLANSVRSGFPQVQKMLAGLGRFQALTYKSTLAGGADVFSALYENGSLEWVINPPGQDGKIQNLAFSFETRPQTKPETNPTGGTP